MSMTYSSHSIERSGSPEVDLPSNAILKGIHSLAATCTLTWSGLSIGGERYLLTTVWLFKVVNNTYTSLGVLDSDQYFPSASSGSRSISLEGTAAQIATKCVDAGTEGVTYVARLTTLWTGDSSTIQTDTGITVYPYSPPTISTFAVNRCLEDGTNNEDGTYVEATVEFAASAVGDNNELTLKIYRKLTSDSSYTLDSTIDISALGYSGTTDPTILTLTYLAASGYDLKAVLTDIAYAVNNVKTIQPSFRLMDYDIANKQIAFGKSVTSGGPGFDVAADMGARFRGPVDFDKAPTIAAAKIAAFFAKHAPICILSGVAEDAVSVGSNRCWVMNFQTVERNDDDQYDILLGGSGNTRKMGFEIPADGYYRVTHTVWLGGSTSSRMCMRFFQMDSDWTPPAANYQNEATPLADADFILARLNLIPAWSAYRTCGQFSVDFHADAGDKIWPTFYLPDGSKTIEADGTFASIQRIG